MMIPTHIPSEETSPTLCCWFCSTSIVPVPVTQTRTGTLRFCRGGSDRSACEKSEIRVCITTQLNVQFKMPVQFPWNQQAFTGNQEQSSSIQGLLMAGLCWSHHPTPLLLHPALRSRFSALGKWRLLPLEGETCLTVLCQLGMLENTFNILCVTW